MRYASDGLFSTEDFWELRGARETSIDYAAACDSRGQHWPDGPSWARGPADAAPTWLGRGDRPGITKPREVYAFLGRDRWTRPGGGTAST